jgi:hypothetical protein
MIAQTAVEEGVDFNAHAGQMLEKVGARLHARGMRTCART